MSSNDPTEFTEWLNTVANNVPYSPYKQAAFSLLDARRGPWMSRKRHWLDKGIKGELGRDTGLLRGMSSVGERTVYGVSAGSGKRGQYSTSVFDPVLCEVIYQWFAPKHGRVLDPFAGGSVRGVVAASMGRSYCGVDLNERQVEENIRQAKEIEVEGASWVYGDSQDIANLVEGSFDFIFSCPPYWNLEVYSDDERDLSAMSYDDFLTKYRSIIARTVERLHDNRFACFVVGEVRGKDGNYVGLVPDTIRAFQDAGMGFYNEMVYTYPDGSLPMRAPRSLRISRKISKMHQNVLVFLKGDAKIATAHLDEISQ